jgi:uncharacterized delta-60 repeat protein
MRIGNGFRVLLMSVWICCAPFAAATDGDPDPGFSDDGQATIAVTPPASNSEWAYSVLQVSNGMLVGGMAFSADLSSVDFHVVKYLPNGLIDTSWGLLGRRSVKVNGYGIVYRMFQEPDGKILLAGMSSGRPTLARLTISGGLDTSFGNGGVAMVDIWSNGDNGSAWYVADNRGTAGRVFFIGTRKPDVVCIPPMGCPDPEDVDPQPVVIAMTRTGVLDTSFSNDGVAMLVPALTKPYPRLALAVDGSGRPVVAVEHAGPVVLTRLLENGSTDPSFGASGFMQTTQITGNPFSLLLDDERRRIYLYNTFAIRALREDGSLDPTFGNAGITLLDQWDQGSWINQFVLQGDGKLLGAGGVQSGVGGRDVFLIRLGVNGLPDPTFRGNGVRRVAFDLAPGAADVAMGVGLAGGKPVAVGYAADADGNHHWAVLRTQNTYTFANGFE